MEVQYADWERENTTFVSYIFCAIKVDPREWVEDDNGNSYTEYANEQLFIEHCSMKIKRHFFMIISSAVRCK